MMVQHQYTRFIVRDETCVRMEDIPNTTLEVRGAKSVPLRTSGKERHMSTVWLAAEIELEDGIWE